MKLAKDIQVPESAREIARYILKRNEQMREAKKVAKELLAKYGDSSEIPINELEGRGCEPSDLLAVCMALEKCMAQENRKGKDH